MITLYDGTTVSECTAATALTLAARRKGWSYGELTANTDGWTQQQIIREYLDTKQGTARRRRRPAGKTCGDCALWRRDERTKAGGWCPVPKKGTNSPCYRNRKNRACMQFEERMPPC